MEATPIFALYNFCFQHSACEMRLPGIGRPNINLNDEMFVDFFPISTAVLIFRYRIIIYCQNPLGWAILNIWNAIL